MGLSDEALSVVAQVRSSNPARRVGGRHSNVTGRYPSRKMEATIQFESHRVELPTMYELEHNDEVLECWDQPNSIKLDYENVHGRQRPGVNGGPLCQPEVAEGVDHFHHLVATFCSQL